MAIIKGGIKTKYFYNVGTHSWLTNGLSGDAFHENASVDTL